MSRNWVHEAPAGTAIDAAVTARCEPLVLRGLCRHWPSVAMGLRSLDELQAYLTGLDNGKPAQAFLGPPGISGRYYFDDGLDGFNFERQMMTLSAALGRIRECVQDADLGTIYVGSAPIPDHLPGFAADNRLDGILGQVEPRIWIGNASNVSCHFDTMDNVACVVAGRRRFTLYPPEAIADLYVGPIDRTMAGQPVGLAAGSERGDPRYPRFERLRDEALVAELEPGDALYLPKLWWHQVEATSDVNVLVNYWWDAFNQGPDAPYTAMMLAMIAIAERPLAERQAWRSFFDHYVFRPEGHPLRHLPEDKHGILGPLRDGNYGKIRAMVMRVLRGS